MKAEGAYMAGSSHSQKTQNPNTNSAVLLCVPSPCGTQPTSDKSRTAFSSNIEEGRIHGISPKF